MENTNTNEKYYRQNGDVVEGKDIPAVRTQQLKDTIRNGRLGTYNAHGRYILSPKVTNEIFGITKYVYKQHFDEVLKESKGVLEFKATASIPVFGQMEFRLVFKDHIARLYMIENVYREFNGYQEIYGEQITEINCEDDRSSVVDYVFALLNVKVIDEVDFGKIPDEDPEKVKAIIFDKLYLTMVAKNYLKESSDDERDAFEDMINALKGGGEYGKRVLKHFIDRIEKRPDIMQLKDEDGYNEALNDALIGALEVATTEEDMKDPHNKKIYEDIYKRRFKQTEEDLRKAQEKVNEKDLKKVADGVLGRGTSDKLYTEDELASLIDGKREETKQGSQDNSLVDDLLQNPIVKQVIDNVAGRTVGEKKEEHQDPSKTNEEAQAASLGGDTHKKDNDPKPPPGGSGSGGKDDDKKPPRGGAGALKEEKSEARLADNTKSSGKNNISNPVVKKPGGSQKIKKPDSSKQVSSSDYTLTGTAGKKETSDKKGISVKKQQHKDEKSENRRNRLRADEMGLGDVTIKSALGNVGYASRDGKVTSLEDSSRVEERRDLGDVEAHEIKKKVDRSQDDKINIIKKHNPVENLDELADDLTETSGKQVDPQIDAKAEEAIMNLGFADLIEKVGEYRAAGLNVREAVKAAEKFASLKDLKFNETLLEMEDIVKNEINPTITTDFNKQSGDDLVIKPGFKDFSQDK